MTTNTDSFCARCQCEKDWQDCWQCGGEGEIDRYEEDPMWYVGAWRYQTCENCEGEGGYLVCPNAENHKAHVPDVGEQGSKR